MLTWYANKNIHKMKQTNDAKNATTFDQCKEMIERDKIGATVI